jgi:hypothetical protein
VKARSDKAARRRQEDAGITDRQERVEITLGNPGLFGDVYIGPYDPRWEAPLPRVAREFMVFMASVKRGVVYTPPEFLKSTSLQVYALWLTARYAAAGRLGELTGLFLSEEAGLAERNLSVVSWHIDNNVLLREDFVDVAGRPLLEPDPDEDKWTDSEIIVRRGGKVKDPTWQAKGLTGAGIQGARILHMLGDDVITPRSAGSPTVQERAINLWDTQITTRVLEDGQAVATGNYNGPADMLAKLAARTAYAVLRRPSLHVPGDRSKAPDDPRDPEAVLQVPVKWSRERLLQELDEKPNRFRRVHLLDSSAEAGERLKVAWVQVIQPENTPTGQAKWVMALDPTGEGESDDPDFFNISVGAIHGTGVDSYLDLAISHDSRMSTTEGAELVAAYHDRFSRVGQGVAAIGIGKITLDRVFGGSLKILRPDIRPKLVPIEVLKQNQSKIERLEGLGTYAKSGWLRVWEPAWIEKTSAKEDQPREPTLFEQWRDFPNLVHDDKLDGLDVLIRTAIDYGDLGARPTRVKLKVAR